MDKFYIYDFVKVEKIVDGDTVHVMIDTYIGEQFTRDKIRLADIDTPETRGIEKRHGELAEQKLIELINSGGDLQLELVPLNPKEERKDKIRWRDSFGRALGILYTESGRSINQMMIDKGYAWKYSKKCTRDLTLLTGLELKEAGSDKE